MAISGRVIAMLLKCTSKLYRGVHEWPRKWLYAVMMSLMVLITAGCASPSFHMGKPPLFERIGELKAGVSTMQDVMVVLGEPQGRGATRSSTFGLKKSWLYESIDNEGGKARMRMLMVFFDKDTGIYQGHMWMASGMLFGQTK